MLDKVVNNSIWTGIGAIGTTLLHLAFAGLTIRWLGLEDAGFALLIQAVAGMNAAVTGLGFYSAGIRYISEAEASGDTAETRTIAETMLSSSLVLNALLALIVVLLTPLLVAWSSYTGDPATTRLFVILVASTSVLQGVALTMKSGIEARRRYDIISKRDLLFGVLYGVCCITVLKFYPSLITLGLMQVAFAVANLVVYTGVYHKIFGYVPRPILHRALFAKLWKFGRWSYINSLGNLFLENVDRILVTGFFSASALPVYSMAKRGFLMGHQLIVQQSIYLFPLFAALKENKREKALSVEPKLRWFITALSLALYSAMVLVGPAALNLLVGDGFGTSTEPLILLFAIAGLIEAQSIVPWKLALAFDKPAYTTAYKYGSSVLVMGILLTAGYAGWGLQGAAAAHLAIAIPMALLYIGIWKELRPNESYLRRFLIPLLSPMSAIPVVGICWAFFAERNLTDLERLLITAPVLLLLLPWITRFERGIGEPSGGVATLRRASEMVTGRIPLFREPLNRLARLII